MVLSEGPQVGEGQDEPESKVKINQIRLNKLKYCLSMYNNYNHSDAFINDQEIQNFSENQIISEVILCLDSMSKYYRHDLRKITLNGT